MIRVFPPYKRASSTPYNPNYHYRSYRRYSPYSHYRNRQKKEAREEGGCGIFGGKGGQIDESEGLGDFFERKSCKYEIKAVPLQSQRRSAPPGPPLETTFRMGRAETPSTFYKPVT